MGRFRAAIPLAAAALAGMLVVTAALGLRGHPTALRPTTTGTVLSASSEQRPPFAPNRAPIARGEQLLIPTGERKPAPAFSVQTASFGNGAVFAAPVTDAPATVVFFMAAWCFTCQSEAKALAAIHERYAAEGVTVLVLDVDPHEGERELAAFRAYTGSGGHLWAFDRGFAVAQALTVDQLDTTVVIDRQGRIAYRDETPIGYDYLSPVVEALLAEPHP